MDETIIKVKNTIAKYNMVNPGDCIIVAVSGGPDSVCMLHILQNIKNEYDIRIVVAHFDHGLRPDEDAEETRFVDSLSNAFSLPFETMKADVRAHNFPGPLEERARHARYSFLRQVKEKYAAQKIATGHNLNDQSETVLIRLLRGSGISGLAGIPPIRDNEIIRPLIGIARDEILSYIREKNLNYMTDSSNSDVNILRNRIRLEILPQLKKIQPRIVTRLGQTAEMMRREQDWLTEDAQAWLKKHAEFRRERIRIPLNLFNLLPEARKYRVLRLALAGIGGTLRGIGLQHTDSILRLSAGAKPQARVMLPNKLLVSRRYDWLVFSQGPITAPDSFSYRLNGPGSFYLDALACTFVLTEINNSEQLDPHCDSRTAFLNADLFDYPLEIRSFRHGDRFIPFGMTGHKKLKDFFMDLKLSKEERARIPILTYEDKPIWIGGLRIDARYRVTSETLKVLKVTF